jgi:hypothetical protein
VVQTTSSESVSRKISRKSDEEMKLKGLVRNVCVEVDIVAALDKIVNSVGWWKFGYLGRSSIRLVLLRLVSEDEDSRRLQVYNRAGLKLCLMPP